MREHSKYPLPYPLTEVYDIISKTNAFFSKTFDETLLGTITHFYGKPIPQTAVRAT